MNRALRLLAFAFAVLWLAGCACEDEEKTAALSTIQHAHQCSDGGALFDARNSVCVCGSNQTWSGTRCDQTAAVPPAEPAKVTNVTDTATAPNTGHESGTMNLGEPPHAPPVPPAAKPKTSASVDPAHLQASCRRAKGAFLPDSNYCHCPAGGVLVGQTCRVLTRVTDDVCQRALARGKWVTATGECLCAAGKVFSPNRGGCVAPYQVKAAGHDAPPAHPGKKGKGKFASKGFDSGDMIQRHICETKMNGGLWDAAEGRCTCPQGRVYAGELCVVQHRLTSREVCESDSNRGAWNKGQKRCGCPTGQMWLNQGCVRVSMLDGATACNAESNGGKWDKGRNVCVCPKGRWNAAAKSCR